MLNIIMRLFRRGELRRQAIVQILEAHPDREFIAKEIYITLGSWIGPIHSDLITLYKRGLVSRRERGGCLYYQIAVVRDGVSA